MRYSVLLSIQLGFLLMAKASHATELAVNDLPVLLRSDSPLSCRAALSQCLNDIDNGERKDCELLPVPRRSLLQLVAPGTFVLRKLRSGVWMYSDGAYLSLILKWGERLALVDFPDIATSDTNTGSRTLLTDAIEAVLGSTVPKRIDMVYSHAHFDHIGAATRVYNYLTRRFPYAGLLVWGTEETKKLIEVHKTNRAVEVNVLVKGRGRTLVLGKDLNMKMMIVGGHTQEDLAILIPKSRGGQGIIFYVDVVFPKWSIPFNLAITQDIREMISAQKELLKLDFDIIVPGHLQIGTKKDIARNVKYLEDLVRTSVMVLESVTYEQLAEEARRIQDENAREFGNVFYGFFVTRNLEIDACYRMLIEKWGCRFAALDLFLRGHCFVAITFALTDI